MADMEKGSGVNRRSFLKAAATTPILGAFGLSVYGKSKTDSLAREEILSIGQNSAGTNPKGVSRLAIRVLDEIGIDISSETSDHLDKYRDMQFDYVITLCDDANENCPVFFGGTKRLHMGFTDPPHSNEPTEENLRQFRDVRDAIRYKMKNFFAEELEKRDGAV